MRDFLLALGAVALLAFLLGFVAVAGVDGIAELGIWLARALAGGAAR